ncbi:MAG: alkaline phosphatase D family protein [Polaromonas sp.]|nr:alkaline phosphatase D family protein [Polaromonas sp.]
MPQFHTPTSRRQLLQWAAASTSALWLPSSARSQGAPADNPFGIGVASGSPRHDSVVLWTRLLQIDGRRLDPQAGPQAVRWELAHDERFSRIEQSGQVLALGALAHSVHVEVHGLAADRWYFYRFMLGDAVSPTGRTRTFPMPDALVARLRLAYASCQNWQHGYFSAYRHMLAENVDLVLFLGDYVYEYPITATSLRPGGDSATGWSLTLDDYRQRYALYKSDLDLQAMHQACPWLVTWDDHEVQNDYAGLQEGSGGPAQLSFAARRAAAYQAFYEHMPLRMSALTQALAGLLGGAETRIYQRVNFGRLASFYMLDSRQYRDPQVCTRQGKKGASTLNPASCDAWNDPARSLLGATQEHWLNTELGRAGPQWNLLGQQTLFGQRDFQTHQRPGTVLWNDGWDGYSAARTRLSNALRGQAVPNPVLLGGDVHENWVGRVLADYARPDSAAVAVEFCGTSISSNSSGNALMAERLARNPHFVYADGERKGYGVVELSPRLLTTTLRGVSDVRQPVTHVETLAAFEVQPGKAAVERI